jgi:hypothetical protein
MKTLTTPTATAAIVPVSASQAETSVLLRAEMAEGADERSNLVLGFLQMIAVLGEEGISDPFLRAVDPEIFLLRNRNIIVLRLPEDAALGLTHANHLEGPPIHADGLADRVRIGEKAVFKIRADEHQGHVLFIFDFREKTALRDLGIAHQGGVRGHALEPGASDQIRAVRDFRGGADRDSDFTHPRRVALDVSVFFESQLGILTHRLGEFLGIAPPDKGHP